MAGTLTTSGKDPGPLAGASRIKLDWTSDAAGAVNGTKVRVRGRLANVVFIPGTGGTQPSASYDIVLNDEAGFDVLSGKGANLSNSVITRISPAVPHTDAVPTVGVGDVYVDEELELQVSNAGASKTGSVWLYVAFH